MVVAINTKEFLNQHNKAVGGFGIKTHNCPSGQFVVSDPGSVQSLEIKTPARVLVPGSNMWGGHKNLDPGFRRSESRNRKLIGR